MAAFIFLLLLTIISTAAAADGGGLSLKLIRRRPLSSNASPEKAQSLITPDNTQFLVKLAIGSPPVDVYAILDTGSDLFWTQCLPCAKCYPQTRPIFNPSRSSSYRELSCQTPSCHLTGSGAVCSCNGPCSYSYGYGGGLTEGNLASETMSVSSGSGGKAWFQNVVFGCGHNNTGGFNVNEMGLLGLGRGPVSLISQIGPSVGGKKFSLCLLPAYTDPKISSSIKIGSGSEVQGPGVTTIKLVSIPDPTFYALTLTGISVGTTFLPYNSSGVQPTKGNVILDSGTPPTLLPQDLYNRFVAEVVRIINLPLDPGGNPCYKNLGKFATTPVTLHFDDDVNLPLSTDQTFMKTKDGSFCFVVQGVPGTSGIIGNFMQANFLIGYDIDKMTVSFKPTDCTKIG